MPSEDEFEDLEAAVAEAWPPGEFELVLRKPVSLDGVTVDRLQLREPTCWEWEQIVAQPIDKQRRFGVQLISGVSIKLIAQMGVGDVVRAEKYLLSFFEVGLRIGAA
jgi:hypothetical protein